MSVVECIAAPRALQAWKDACRFRTLEEAEAIVGGLSSPGKMPCSSYGLPAAECGVGSALRAVSTAERPTTCGSCYALKGQYVFSNVQAAQYRRLASLEDPRWVDAMVFLIGWRERDSHVFRWHDSGDLQSVEHLWLICEVADQLPWVEFWLPTREAGILRKWITANGALPANLCVRQSAALVGHFPSSERARNGRTFSAVALPGQQLPEDAWACPAYSQDGRCGSCRACRSTEFPVVVYPLH